MAVPRHLLIALLLASGACRERPAGRNATAGTSEPAPTVDASPTAVAAASNGSIMRPSVIEEVEEAAPAPPLPPRPIRVTIGFPDGGARLDEAARATLDALASRPEFAGDGPIMLRGHTDSEGDDQANLRASRRRAETVRDYLFKKGVAAERMTVIALGERRPVAPNAELDGSDSEKGRRRNRRVDVEVSPSIGATAEGDATGSTDPQSPAPIEAGAGGRGQRVP